MLKKKEYEVNLDATKAMFLGAGFKDNSDYYSISADMYEKIVYMKLLIDKDGGGMAVHMLRSDGDEYAPFWNDDFRRNNRVGETVVRNYNKFMDGLVKQDILIRVTKPKEEKRHGRKENH